MKKIALSVVLLVAALAGLWLWRAATAPPAVSLLPAQTLVFVRIPDIPRAVRQWETSTAHALWQLPEVRAAVQQSVGVFFPGSAIAVTNGAVIQEAQKLFRGEAFLAVTHFSPLVPNRPGIAFGADTRWQKWRAQVVVATVERRLREQNPSLQIRHRQFLGVRYAVWERPNDLPVCYGFLRSWFVVTLGEDVFRDMIGRYVRPHQSGTLGEFADYAAFHRQLPASAVAYVYINPQPMTMLLGHAQLFTGSSTADLSALQAVKSVGMAVSFENGRIHERRVTTYRPEQFQPPPVIARRTLPFTSPDTLWYSASAANLARSYKTVSSLVLQLGLPVPTAVIENFERSLRRADIHWMDDLLPRLGPETAWVVNWRRGSEFPEVAWIAEVHEADQIRGGLEFALRTIGTLISDHAKVPGVWDETPHGEMTLHSLILGDGKVSPTFVVTDEFLVLTSTRDFARALLERRGQRAPTLADDPKFREATAALPAECSEFSYLHLAEVYPRVRTFLQNWSPDLPIPVPALPAPQTFAPYLSPIVSVSTAADNAQRTDVYSPFGPPALWVAGWLTRWAIEQGKLFPAATTTSSDTVPLLPPRENQTGVSRTPPP